MTFPDRIIDEGTAFRCVKACADYLRRRDDSPLAALDLEASVQVLIETAVKKALKHAKDAPTKTR